MGKAEHKKSRPVAGAWRLVDNLSIHDFPCCKQQGVSRRGVIHHVPIANKDYTTRNLFPFRPANKDYKTRDSSSSVAVFVFYGQHITLLGEFKIPILVVRNHAPTLAHGD